MGIRQLFVNKIGIIGYGYWGKVIHKAIKKSGKDVAYIFVRSIADHPLQSSYDRGMEPVIENYENLVKYRDLNRIFVCTGTVAPPQNN